MERFKKFYDAFEDYLTGGLLFTGLTLVMINVIMRYFFGKPQSLLDEFSVYFVIWGTMLGFAVALRDNHHIKVDMLFNIFSPGVKLCISYFANAVGLAFSIFFTFYGFELVSDYITSGQRSSDSQFPLWIVNAVLPLSGIMLGIRFLEKFYQLKTKGTSLFEVDMGGGGDDNTAAF